MQSVQLDAPEGISARLGDDAKVSLHDRRRILAKELVAERLRLDAGDLRIVRDAPTIFGYHTRLFAYVGDAEHPLPLSITTATHADATVVAVSGPDIRVGLDIRSAASDPATLAEVVRHFPPWATYDDVAQLARWGAVQAVLDADARGTRVHPEHVRLDITAKHGRIPDRAARYDLVDLSRSGYLITMAYGDEPDAAAAEPAHDLYQGL